MRMLIVLLMSLVSATAAVAANTPCSGKKGGIDRCQGKKFVCKDGSISGSKRVCNPDAYGKGKKK